MLCAAIALAGLWLAGTSALAQNDPTHLFPYDEEVVDYSNTVGKDPIAVLQKRIDSGEVTLRYDEQFGYLPAMLQELKILGGSQMLVFSKTSLQRSRIGPTNPRALFFNDSTYVGYIPGAPLMELSGVDPRLGGIFYTLEQHPQSKPRFVRTDQCLECHASSKTLGVPGHIARSFETTDDGEVDLFSGTSVVNDRTPFADRWGGWYVTGTHGDQRHKGNLIGKPAFARYEQGISTNGNLTTLTNFFDRRDFLQPGSDIVALMVFEHQAYLHNWITRMHYESTQHLQMYQHIRYLRKLTDNFLRSLLFIDESPLTATVAGTSDFTEKFQKLGPKDGKGRSLRQLNLQTRLMEHPCSFLIYSEAFDGLPAPLKAHIYTRLDEILSGRDTTGIFDKIAPETRRALKEILQATKPDLAAAWKNPPPPLEPPPGIQKPSAKN